MHSESLISIPDGTTGWDGIYIGDESVGGLLSSRENPTTTLQVLCWIVSELRKDPQITGSLKAIAVISVAYNGEAYPSIGWRHSNLHGRDQVDEFIEESVKALIEKRPLVQFLLWLNSNHRDWELAYRNLVMKA